MGRVQAVGIALVMAAARGRFSGIMDIGGCKPPYFYCGSNARCTLETAACERADASAPSCSGTVSGAMYNLSGLRLTKGGANFMASDNTTTVIFDVCANAAPERCPNATAVAVDVTTCERLAGSAWTERMVLTALEHESTSINPAQGVRIRFDDGDRCAPSQNKSLFIDVYCEPTAVHAPVDIVLKRDGDCVSTIALRSAYGCPVGCAAGGANRAPCSGRGECVWTIQDGARCECDRDFAGSACQKYIVRTSTDFRIATWVWQAAAALLVSLTGVSHSLSLFWSHSMLSARYSSSLEDAAISADNARMKEINFFAVSPGIELFTPASVPTKAKSHPVSNSTA